MSEDILMQIPNVKYKKREGVLDITSNGISWEAYKVPGESRSDLMSNLDLSFTDIRSQRTSPESRINLQLQITLYSSNTYVFHFKTAQECGKTEKEYKEQRLRLKEILSEQLPLHRSKTNDKLEDKITFLQNNDHLYMMYKDLVVSKVISADDFWKLKTVQTLVDKYNSNLATESNLAIEFLKKQNQMNNSSVAVSSNFLSNIKLTDKGCKYTLTQELINDIFKAYPEVKKSHQVFVKETREFTEYEFWRFFFTSHYYKRDETKKTKNDLFSQFRLDKNKNKLNQTKLNNLGKPVEKVQKYDDSLAATDNLMWLENYNHIKAVETSEMDKILEPRDFITSISNSVIQKSDISGTNIGKGFESSKGPQKR